MTKFSSIKIDMCCLLSRILYKKHSNLQIQLAIYYITVMYKRAKEATVREYLSTAILGPRQYA